MGLPYSYKSKFYFNTAKTFDSEFILTLLLSVLSNDNNFKDLKAQNNTLFFKSRKSLLNFFYNVELDINVKKNKIIIDYKINLLEVIIISIFLFVFIPFFSKLSLNGFFIFSVIIILIFYLANVIFMSHQLYQYINKSLIVNKIIDDIKISTEQQNWINNPDKCPACGCDINKDTLYCPDCGLKISQNPYTRPLNLSDKQNQKINYHFKEKK